jgi:hypothetical protein
MGRGWGGGLAGGCAGLLLPGLGVLVDVLDEICRRADFVVADAPAVLAAADASALAELADMVLLVADARQPTRAQVRAAAGAMEHVRAALIGCVLDNAGRPGKRRLLPAPQPALAVAGEAAGTRPHGNGQADDRPTTGRRQAGTAGMRLIPAGSTTAARNPCRLPGHHVMRGRVNDETPVA